MILAVNEFLQFDTQNTNSLTNEEYTNDTVRVNGITSGKARSDIMNKSLRNTSTFVAAFGEFIKSKGIDATEDMATLQTNLISLFGEYIQDSTEVPVSEATRLLYELTTGDANVDKVLQKVPSLNLSSYMAFCANVNTNSLDSAFGKNNEALVANLGKQLAMYAWFKGDSKITYPFTNLIVANSVYDVVNSQACIDEINNNSNLINLFEASPYAISLYSKFIDINSLSIMTTLFSNMTRLQKYFSGVSNYGGAVLISGSSVSLNEMRIKPCTKVHCYVRSSSDDTRGFNITCNGEVITATPIITGSTSNVWIEANLKMPITSPLIGKLAFPITQGYGLYIVNFWFE